MSEYETEILKAIAKGRGKFGWYRIEQCVTNGTDPTIPAQTDPAPTDPQGTSAPSTGAGGVGGALPETGSSSTPTALLAVVAVAAGVATIGVTRRRQRNA